MRKQNTRPWIQKALPTALAAMLCALPAVASADELTFVPLTNIPGIGQSDATIVDYLNQLFIIAISIGALLAVLKIAIGGLQYMASGMVTSKEDGKQTIFGALLGLGILLAAYIVLFTIYPNLVSLDILSSAQDDRINIGGRPENGGGGDTEQNECPEGEVYMECQTTNGYSGQCSDPADTSWCTDDRGGEIIEEEDEGSDISFPYTLDPNDPNDTNVALSACQNVSGNLRIVDWVAYCD